MTRIRFALLPVSVALTAALLTGCSGSSDGAADTPATEAGQSATSDTGTVAGSELASRMMTALQEAGSLKMTTEPGNNMPSSTSEVVYNGDKASSRSTVAMGGQSMEVISIDNGAEVYLKAPEMQVPDWVKVEESSDNPMVQAMAQQLSSMQQTMDPAAGLKLYEQAGDFTAAGTESVNGVETTKYTGSIPMDALLSMLGSAGESVPTEDAEPVEVQLFLDSEDRPVQVAQKLTMGGQQIDTVVKYSDYGAPITVEAPQAGS